MGAAHIYLDQPDPLSELLTRLELQAEVYVSGEFCGTWAVDTAGSRRMPFHFIGDGEAWLHFENDPPRHLQRRDLVVFPHDAHHVISNSRRRPGRARINQPMSNDGAVTHMVCGFFEFRSPAIFPVLDSLPPLVFLPSAAGSASGRLLDLILQELAAARPGHYAAIDQLALLVFVEILRQRFSSGELSGGLLAALFDARLGRALNALHRCPEQPWTLALLAEQAAMSRSSFSERFSKVVGMAPIRYLTLWRMSEARRLLQRSEFSTAQVAERCGYETEAALRKAFRNTLGETPGAVRARLRGETTDG